MWILIVEDDERIISFLKRGLEAEGYDVDSATNKSDAMRAIQCGNYDAIILDVFLGADNGLDLCRELRTLHNATPILIVSATGSPDMRRNCILVGADAFLGKPFSFDQIVSKLQKMACVNPETATPSMYCIKDIP